MSKLYRYAAMAALAGVLALTLGQANSAGGPSPPHSKAFGKSLDEWQKLYWTWFLGGDQGEQVRNVRFFALPEGVPDPEPDPDTGLTNIVGELEVSRGPGEAFVLPILVFVGESYVQDVPDDDPDDIPFELFTAQRVLVTLNGDTLIDSEVDDLDDFTFGPEFFDDPIVYPEPIPRGEDLDADAAIWVKGIGFVHPPLSVGTHTLVLYAELDFIGIAFLNTWTITVEP